MTADGFKGMYSIYSHLLCEFVDQSDQNRGNSISTYLYTEAGGTDTLYKDWMTYKQIRQDTIPPSPLGARSERRWVRSPKHLARELVGALRCGACSRSPKVLLRRTYLRRYGPRPRVLRCLCPISHHRLAVRRR